MRFLLWCMIWHKPLNTCIFYLFLRTCASHIELSSPELSGVMDCATINCQRTTMISQCDCLLPSCKMTCEPITGEPCFGAQGVASRKVVRMCPQIRAWPALLTKTWTTAPCRNTAKPQHRHGLMSGEPRRWRSWRLFTGTIQVSQD